MALAYNVPRVSPPPAAAAAARVAYSSSARPSSASRSIRSPSPADPAERLRHAASSETLGAMTPRAGRHAQRPSLLAKRRDRSVSPSPSAGSARIGVGPSPPASRVGRELAAAYAPASSSAAMPVPAWPPISAAKSGRVVGNAPTAAAAEPVRAPAIPLSRIPILRSQRPAAPSPVATPARGDAAAATARPRVQSWIRLSTPDASSQAGDLVDMSLVLSDGAGHGRVLTPRAKQPARPVPSESPVAARTTSKPRQASPLESSDGAPSWPLR